MGVRVYGERKPSQRLVAVSGDVSPTETDPAYWSVVGLARTANVQRALSRALETRHGKYALSELGADLGSALRAVVDDCEGRKWPLDYNPTRSDVAKRYLREDALPQKARTTPELREALELVAVDLVEKAGEGRPEGGY